MNALSNLLDYWRSGGPLLLPMAFVCMGIWGYFLRSRRALLEALRMPAGSCQAARLGRLDRDFVILAALTAAAPLLGLLGTVVGMVETFDAVAYSASAMADRTAAGISKALITTQFGLVIALPGVFGLALLRRMRSQLSMQSALYKAHLLLGIEQETRA